MYQIIHTNIHVLFFVFFFLSDPYTMHCEYDVYDSLIVSFISFLCIVLFLSGPFCVCHKVLIYMLLHIH